MNKDMFTDLIAKAIGYDQSTLEQRMVGVELLGEFDRLTAELEHERAAKAQLREACKAARRHLTEDGMQDFEPIIIQLRAAIRAAEEKQNA